MTKRLLAVICCASLLSAHAGSSTNYTSNPESINSGGGTASSASYTMRATLGQPFAPAASSSASYAIKSGLWHMGPGASLVQQATTTFNIVLEGAQEVPVNGSPAAGSGTAVVDPNVNTIALNLTFTGLTSAATMAHLHGPGARGVSAGIKINLNTTSPLVQTVTYNEADEADILAGLWYVNIHTGTFGGGEIRGQLDNVGAAPRRLLTVNKAGTGSGTVTSDVGGINCGATCTYNSPQGLVVTLAAAPTGGGTFAGWSGAGCTGTGQCVVTMDAAKSVTATFTAAPGTFGLTVTKAGTGTGTVASTPPGTIDCGATCSANITSGAGVTLVATAGANSTFTGWSGDCSGTGQCNLTMSAARSVTATFALAQYTVTPSAGAGGTLSPATPQTVNHGATTFFTVTPSAGYEIASVTGCGGSLAGSTYTTAAITANCTVAASFQVVNPPRLSNISTRMQVLTGDDVMIGGFVIAGATTKRVAIVATGPSLTAYGIANPLANPTLRLVRQSDGAVIAINDDWQSAANQADLTAAGFAPSHPLEAAILADLAPGAYTAIVEGAGGGTGVSVIGVYEVDHPETPLINIATRGRVLTGIDVMIGGFVINGTGPQAVAIVATGPSLANFGIASPLANPKITLVRSSDQAAIDGNDDWQSHANASQLAAVCLAPANPLEAAIYRSLPPGAYTAIVEGVGGGTGVAVIAVYKAPSEPGICASSPGK